MHMHREWLQCAEEIAREAGDVLLGFVGRDFDVRRKGAVDLVTEADRASEAAVVRAIRTRYPAHGILAEEGGGDDASGSEPLWVVDPLDGTTNFAHGLPIWCVSIAVLVGGRPVVGVIYDPSREECFTATAGGSAKLNGREIRVSRAARLDDALLVTGFPYDVRTSPTNNVDHFANFLRASQGVRRLGSAALDLCYVAAGRFDGFWELKLHAWDVAAGGLIVERAGGRVSDFEGRPWDPFGPEILAAPPELSDAMIEVLRGGRRPVADPSR
jgi:myo-inositol-1(or 4)-monophosphatase